MKERDGGREDQWFRENEARLLEQARVLREKRAGEAQERNAAEERERSRERHYMKCPKCGHDMREEELGTIHVDRCGLCGGTYFDAGELDQLVLKREQDGRGFFRKLIGI